MENDKKTVCAVLVTYNRKELLLNCMESLTGQTYPLDAVCLVDNASTDGTPGILKEKGYIDEAVDGPVEREYEITSGDGSGRKLRLHYIRLERNTGGAGGFYEGVKKAAAKRYDWMWLMDDDSDPDKSSLEKLARYFNEQNTSALASAVYLPDGRIFYPTRGKADFNNTFPLIQNPLPEEAYRNRICEIDIASFVGILVSRKAVDKVGLPKKEFFLRHDDVEYCLRLRREGRILLVPESRIYHEEVQPGGVEKRFLWKRSLRTPYDKFWLTYYARRNLVWLGKQYANNRVNFYIGSLKSIARMLLDILVFDDNKISRMVFLIKAYADGYRGAFDNDKPRRLLYGRD